MSIKDTSFTNPDFLRALYLSPKNPLRALDENATAAENQAIASIVNNPVGQFPGGQGGGSGSGGGSGGGGGVFPCPAASEYVLRFDMDDGASSPVIASTLKSGDYLVNPITNTYHRITLVELVAGVECVRVTTMDGAARIVSFSHPVIGSFADDQGLKIEKMLERPDLSYGAVSCINFKANETEILFIEAAGKRAVIKISLESGFIYASGTTPLKLICGHNIKRDTETQTEQPQV